jgi:hypothetical protein
MRGLLSCVWQRSCHTGHAEMQTLVQLRLIAACVGSEAGAAAMIPRPEDYIEAEVRTRVALEA